MSETALFPSPLPEYGAEPYWQGCDRGELVMQRCSDCERLRWTPSPLCPDCGSDAHVWSALSGRGKLTTWTVITHPVHPAAVDLVPYIVAEIELAEQADLRMIAALVDIDPEAITFDLPVEVVFRHHHNRQQLPVFRPRRP